MTAHLSLFDFDSVIINIGLSAALYKLLQPVTRERRFSYLGMPQAEPSLQAHILAIVRISV
jgi:hypothetical protein